jgi:tetratricopeptide (TPR) repeat protein
VKPLVGLLLVLTFAAPMYSAQNKSAQPDWLVEAKAAEQARDFGRAAESYTNFLKEHSDRADVWQRLGLAYYLDNRFDKAAPALERASQLDPTLWAAELFLGISECRLGQFVSARVALEKALAAKRIIFSDTASGSGLGSESETYLPFFAVRASSTL